MADGLLKDVWPALIPVVEGCLRLAPDERLTASELLSLLESAEPPRLSCPSCRLVYSAVDRSPLVLPCQHRLCSTCYSADGPLAGAGACEECGVRYRDGPGGTAAGDAHVDQVLRHELGASVDDPGLVDCPGPGMLVDAPEVSSSTQAALLFVVMGQSRVGKSSFGRKLRGFDSDDMCGLGQADSASGSNATDSGVTVLRESMWTARGDVGSPHITIVDSPGFGDLRGGSNKAIARTDPGASRNRDRAGCIVASVELVS